MLAGYDFVEAINDKVERYVQKLDHVKASDLGLDSRAGYCLYVDEDRTTIVVDISNDRTLQYYGGFEYINKEYRQELGDWVFYFDGDERVSDCFAHLSVNEQ